MARVDADLLDTMLNNAGEVSIFRARLDQQVNSIDFNLAELARTVTRLKEQLRGLEIETEAQVLHRHQNIEPRRDDFDPLELDRYSALQQFSRALAETSSDVASIQGLLETLTREAQSLLTQQARVITELQNSLMRTRMVPFQRHVQRLTRLVRQAANDTGKRAELAVQGAAAELDRQMLERMVAPLEHMLRNSVVHGIEAPDKRAQLGKPDVGRISISLERDGAEIVIVVADDGAGINVKLIREKAIALGLIDAHAKLTDEEAVQLILEPGFSTAGHVTQAAGRGVGMDVVATEVKKLGGGLFIDSTYGKGSRFTIRLPFTLAISQALIVRVAEETYALPLATVEGVVRLPRNIVSRHLGKDAPLFEYGGQKYRFQHLGSFVGLGATRLPDSDVSMSVVLIRAGEHSTALVTDELVGSREIVVKSLGPQISAIRGIAGRHDLGRRPHRSHSRHGFAGAIRVARAPHRDSCARSTRPAHLRARRGRLDYRAPRNAAPAGTQRHARVDGEGRRRRRIAAAGEFAGHHPAGYRNAAHGRLRGRRARAQRSAPEADSDRHDHLTGQRETPRASDRARRG